MKGKADLYNWKRQMCASITVIDGECINKHGTVIAGHDIIGCAGCPYEFEE